MTFVRLRNLIGNDVEIVTTRSHKYKGCVYSIDPRLESFILVTENNGVFKANYINGIFIKTVTVLGTSKLSKIKLFPATEKIKHVKLKKLQAKVKDWLLAHRMEVTENGLALILFDSVTISPPYKSSDCCSTNNNTTVLERVQNLIATFPRN